MKPKRLIPVLTKRKHGRNRKSTVVSVGNKAYYSTSFVIKRTNIKVGVTNGY